MSPKSSLVADSWFLTRSQGAFVRLLLVLFSGDWPQSVATVLEPARWKPFSTPISSAKSFRAAVTLPFALFVDIKAMPADHVLAKLDFSNAVNSLHRHDMLLAVLDRVPELYAYCCSAYSHLSTLFFGSHTISSEKGPKHSDPLGSLLFWNTIQPLLSSLAPELNLG